MNEIKVEKRIHDLWKGIKEVEVKLGLRIPPTVGKYQYIYKSKKGTISLVSINRSLSFKEPYKDRVWEICGGGIVELQRFPTKKKADRFIRTVLS